MQAVTAKPALFVQMSRAIEALRQGVAALDYIDYGGDITRCTLVRSGMRRTSIATGVHAAGHGDRASRQDLAQLARVRL